MKAHELGRKLLGGPDEEVVIVDHQEYGPQYWTVDEVVQVEKQPRGCRIEAPFVELQ